LSHLFDFAVNGFEMGSTNASQVDLKQAGPVNVTCNAAAMLAENPTPDLQAIRTKRLDEKPYWHIERSRIAGTRTVPVELIVNGIAVDKKIIPADGTIQKLDFKYELKQSSWIALRIFPSCHTNPIFVEVDGKPIRASRRSAEWCAKAVDVCWNSKQRAIRESERPAAKAAYDKAREIYVKIAAESSDE
jgi:hypothetical protein